MGEQLIENQLLFPLHVRRIRPDLLIRRSLFH